MSGVYVGKLAQSGIVLPVEKSGIQDAEEIHADVCLMRPDSAVRYELLWGVHRSTARARVLGTRPQRGCIGASRTMPYVRAGLPLHSRGAIATTTNQHSGSVRLGGEGRRSRGTLGRRIMPAPRAHRRVDSARN